MLTIRPDHITNGNQAATLALLWAVAIQFEVCVRPRRHECELYTAASHATIL